MSRNTTQAKGSGSLWQEQPPLQLVPPAPKVEHLEAPDNAGLQLLKTLQEDAVWMQRGNVLYQGDYLPRPDYIRLLVQLLSGNEQEYAAGYQELRRQQEALEKLKGDTALSVLSLSTMDEYWRLLEQLHDVWRVTPPRQVFWYGPLTGYPSGMVSSQEYMSRCQVALESGEPQRIEAVIVAMQRTLDPWKVVHGEK